MIARFSGLSGTLKRRGISICLMGAEGAGKTTLAQQLEVLLVRAELETERRHVYGFARNTFVTPFVLLWNRFVGGKVLIFDRGIFDNLANVTVTRQWARKALPTLLMFYGLWYPRHDHSYYLEASIADTLERRPQTDVEKLQRFLSAYRRIADSTGFQIFVTKPQLLRNVLDAMLSTHGR